MQHGQSTRVGRPDLVPLHPFLAYAVGTEDRLHDRGLPPVPERLGPIHAVALALTRRALDPQEEQDGWPWPRRDRSWRDPLKVLHLCAGPLAAVAEDPASDPATWRAAWIALPLHWRALTAWGPEAEGRWDRLRAQYEEDDEATIPPPPDIRALLERGLVEASAFDADVGTLVRAVLDGAPLEEVLALVPAVDQAPKTTTTAAVASPPPEHLALAHLTGAIRAGGPIPTKAECARAAGCSRQATRAWPSFNAAWKHAKASEHGGHVRRGYRDVRTGDVEAEDAPG